MGLSRVGSGGKGGEDFPPPGGGEEEGEERRGSQTPVDPKGSADIYIYIYIYIYQWCKCRYFPILYIWHPLAFYISWHLCAH